MPTVDVNGVSLFYESKGEGPETIVFSHGYLMDSTMYAEQVNELSKNYRCICFEHRGHGRSELAHDGYTMDNLVTDAIALIEALNLGPVHYVGMSTGGFVALRIALRRPELLRSMALLSTSAEGESTSALKKNTLLLNVVHWIGWWPVIGQVLKMVFHSTFLNDTSRRQEINYWKDIFTKQNKRTMYLFGKAIFARDKSLLNQLTKISLPTLVIVGEKDLLTPVSRSRNLATHIQGADLIEIPDAGHGVTMEKAPQVTAALRNFYVSQSVNPD